MGIVANIQTILDNMTDAALGVFVKPAPPGAVDLNQISIPDAIQLVLEGASDWTIRKTVQDSSGVSITAAQVKTFRTLVEKEVAERDAILNPPPEGEELP